MENVLSDFGKVRSNLFKTQKIPNQTKKTDKQKTELKVNKGIRKIRKFHLSSRQQIVQCSICYEAWPWKETDKNSKEFFCTRCLRDKGFPRKFSYENNMIPSAVPLELENLTHCEEMLIARAFPVMQVYIRPNSRTTGYKGHIVTLPHNVQHIVKVLPRYMTDLSILCFTVKWAEANCVHFQVRRNIVHKALLWLKKQSVIPEYCYWW